MADLNARAIYVLPLPSSSRSTQILGKRRRRRSSLFQIDEDGKFDSNTEYLAVITPEERAQRRLAGHHLNKPPPPAPFPHAPQPGTSRLFDENALHGEDHAASIDPGKSSSIRNDHLAVMMAILHRSLEQKDYIRAGKAIAIVLRTETSGRSTDIRRAGLWSIGAEILMRNHTEIIDFQVSRKGFEKAKALYDKLALQHPWHRTWPNAVNAQDFKLAMFDLWVYTVHVESKRVKEQYVSEDESVPSTYHELQAKRWELGEADTISKEMDSLMVTVPFIDHLELIRLRAMVALWTADLLDAVDLLAADAESENSLQEPISYDPWTSNIDDPQSRSTQRASEKANASRSLAQRLFLKLGIRSNGTSVREEEEYHSDTMY